MDRSSCFEGGCGSIRAEKEEIRLSYCEYEPPREPTADSKNNLLRLLGGLWAAVDLKQSSDADTNPSDDFLLASIAVQYILKRLGLWCALQFVVFVIEELECKRLEQISQHSSAVEGKEEEVKTPSNDLVRNVLERIRLMLSNACFLNIGNAAAETQISNTNLCSNDHPVEDTANPSSTVMSFSQISGDIRYSTSLQVRMLLSLILRYKEELKVKGVTHTTTTPLPACYQVLVFVKEPSTALVIHQLLSKGLSPLACGYFLGDRRKSLGLQCEAEAMLCAFQMGKIHVLVLVAAAGVGNGNQLPSVGLVIVFDEFQGFVLEQISKYVQDSNGSLILMNERHDEIGMKRLNLPSVRTVGSQNYVFMEKEQCHTRQSNEPAAVHSMMTQTGPKEQLPSQGRLHRRDLACYATNPLETKKDRIQKQKLVDHSAIAPLTAEALNLLEISTLLWQQQPPTFVELLIYPLSTTSVYNMNTLGCVKFDIGQPTGNGSPLPLGFATLKPLPGYIMAEFGLGLNFICCELKPEQVERLVQWHCACVNVFVRGKKPDINEMLMEYTHEKNGVDEKAGSNIKPLDKGYIFVPLNLSLQCCSCNTAASLDWTSVNAFLSPSEGGGNNDDMQGQFDLEDGDLPVVWCKLSAKKTRMYFVMQVMRLTYGEYMDKLKEERSKGAAAAPPPPPVLPLSSPQFEHEEINDNNKTKKKVALGWTSLVSNNFPPPIGLSVEESKALALAEWYTKGQRETSDVNQRLYLAYPAASGKEVFLHHAELAAYKLNSEHNMTTHVVAPDLSADDVTRLRIGEGCTDVDKGNYKLKFRHLHTGPPRMLIPQYLTHVKLPRIICGALMIIGPLAFDLERCLAVHKFADEIFRSAVLRAGRKWQLEPATHLLSCAFQHGSFVGERLEIFGDHWLGFYIALYVILVVKEEELMGCYHADLVCNARLLVAVKKMGISYLLPSPRDWRPSMCTAPKEEHSNNMNRKTLPDVMEALIGCFVLTAGDYCGEALLEYCGYNTISGLLKSHEEVDKPLRPPPNLTTTMTEKKKSSMEEESGRSSPRGDDAVCYPRENEAEVLESSRTNGLSTWPLRHAPFVHFQSILTHGTIFPIEYISTSPVQDLMTYVIQVENTLGYKFRIPWLCLQALTHSSSVEDDPLLLAEDLTTATAGHVIHVRSTDYERMYFLGSFILNYIVMAHLYHWDTMLTPEDLSSMKSSITISTRLNLIAMETLSLLKVFRGRPHVLKAIEASISGEHNDNFNMAKEMSKILKSLMAAIFLDSDGCLAVVSEVFWPFLAPSTTRDKQKEPPERCTVR